MGYITHEMNKHNCQLCKLEFLGRCYGSSKYGQDVSLDNEPCEEYEFGGSEERLKEIEGENVENYMRDHCNHKGLKYGTDLYKDKSDMIHGYKFDRICCVKFCPICGKELPKPKKIYPGTRTTI